MAYNYYNYPQMQPIMQQPQPQQTPTVNNTGFVSVRNEMEARNYPVAYGNSVTFKDETAPYIYTKTMGFSQLDRPIFDKYKLVKETPQDLPETPTPVQDNKEDIQKLQEEIEAIWKELEVLKKKPVNTSTKKVND